MLCLFALLRLGPSASQLGAAGEDKILEVAKAISLIQSVMKESWVHALLGHDTGGTERGDAVKGKPAPSKPSLTPKDVGLTMPPPPVPKKRQPDEKKPEENTTKEDKEDAKIEPKEEKTEGGKDGLINSSTHRQSHARLTRRMAAINEADCPNMVKLWNGSRKDSMYD